MKKTICVLAFLLSLLLLSTLIGCSGNNTDPKETTASGTSETDGPDTTSLALVNDRIVLDSEEDMNLLTPFNDYGEGEPILSLDTSIKKFGSASVKVVAKANPKFNSDNSWPSVELAFKKPQNFTTKKYTQFNIYSAEDDPFVMDIQFSVEGSSGYKSNIRQINPGWNVIEIANGKARDFTVPVDYSKITSFIVSTYGHATKDCTYYIDDIVLTDETGMSGDVYELVTLKKTAFAETRGGNLMLPYTMFGDSVASMPTTLELTDDGKLILTQYNEWHFLMLNAFNVGLRDYAVLSVDFENIDDKPVDIGIAAEGGDYTDGGPRIAPSAAMVRRTLQPGEKATLNLEISKIVKALRGASTSLDLDNLSFFHIFSVGEIGEYRKFAVTSIQVLTEKGLSDKNVKTVTSAITALPAIDELTTADTAAVRSVRAAYTALTEEEKALITNIDVLTAAEDRIAALSVIDNSVEAVTSAINNLKQTGSFTTEDVEAILAARKAFNELPGDKKDSVENYTLLESAEAKMLSVFDFNADSAAGFKAGLYGANSACQVQVGYTDKVIGGVSGAGWFSSAIKEGAFIMSEDTNGNGYADDNASSYVGTNFDPVHAKSAYQALLDAGFTTVAFKIYVTAEAGRVDVWSRYADEAGCFFWFGSQPFDTWIDVKLPLDKFVEKYDVIKGDMFSLISFNVNAATPLTTVYLTDIEIVGKVYNDFSTAGGIKKAIDQLPQNRSFSGDDIATIFAAREAYNALPDERKAEVDNVALLEAAETKMLTIFDFKESIGFFNAGLYGANSQCQTEVGYTSDTIGGVDGAGWFSTKIKEGAFLMSADYNGDGYANDDASSYIGTHFKAAHSIEAYKALLDAGYTKVTFRFFVTAEAGKAEIWSRFAEDAFYWLGSQPFDTWITMEIPFEKFVENYDAISSDIYSLVSVNVNAAATLTTVYLSDVVVSY